MLPRTGLVPRPTFHCCSLLLNRSKLKYSKSAVKFVCVVKEIDHTLEQKMLKHVIRARDKKSLKSMTAVMPGIFYHFILSEKTI